MPITKQQRMSATKKLNIAPTVLKGRGAPPGSGHVSKTEILQRMIENDAVRFLNGRFVDPDGNNIDPYEFTWAEFLTLVSTDYAGITIRITDRHQDSRGVGGILVTGGASWTLESPQIYYATFANAPSAASYPGWRITGPWAGLGSPVLYSNGTLWRYQLHTPVLIGHIYNVTKSSNKDTEEIVLQCTIPINNGKSLFQPGDRLVCELAMSKTGSADKLYRNYRLGTAGTTEDTSVLDGSDPATASSAASIGWDERVVFVLEDSTHTKKSGPVGSVQFAGISGTTRAVQVAVTNPDSSISYFSLGIKLVDGASDGIADTQKVEDCEIYIIHTDA